MLLYVRSNEDKLDDGGLFARVITNPGLFPEFVGTFLLRVTDVFLFCGASIPLVVLRYLAVKNVDYFSRRL